jgi:hypothetical protein
MKCMFCTICHFRNLCRDCEIWKEILCSVITSYMLSWFTWNVVGHFTGFLDVQSCLSDCVGVSIRACCKIWTWTQLNKGLNSHRSQYIYSGEENSTLSLPGSKLHTIQFVALPNVVLAVTAMLFVSMPWTQRLSLIYTEFSHHNNT